MNSRMNSRERVMAALDHREADRVPFDLGGTAQTGVHVAVYPKLRQCLGLPPTDIKARQMFAQTAELHEDFLDTVAADTRHIVRRSTTGERYHVRREGDYHVCTDQWGVVYRKPVDGGFYYDVWQSPLDTDELEERLKTFEWPDPADEWHYERLRGQAQRARDKGKVVVLQGFTAGIVEEYAWLRGYERFFLDLGSDHRAASRLLDKLVEIKASYWEQALTRLGDLVDVVNESDDLASQESLLMSPRTYRGLIKPRHKQLYAAIKKAAPHVKIFLHSCGALWPFIPDFIELGVDVLNPLQLSARGMDLPTLKREYGRDIAFWGGGVDTQRVLGVGSPQEVRDSVRRNIDILAPGGGFVFAADHIIQPNVPPENFVAMCETLQECGAYQ